MTAIPSVPYWQPALGAVDAFVQGMDDLAQSIRIVITTPKGSVPLLPEFGCDILPLLDNPLPGVMGRVVREVSLALATWEPRIKVTKVQMQTSGCGAATLAVSWIPKGDPSAAPTTTSATVPAGSGGSSDDILEIAIGAPGGVAPLDPLGQIPATYLPSNLQTSAGDTSAASEVVDGGELA
jgi:phage baseplate assembly protein W